ncbi:MAG: hypothetical protein ACREMJ_01130 [Gemmatimonadales bacterium]
MTTPLRIAPHVGALLALLAAPALAQSRGLREVGSGNSGSLGLLIAQPVGEFRQFVGVHPGFGAAFTFGGPIGLRVGGSLLVYGHERDYVPIGGGRVLLDLDTDNLIASLGVGPQVTLGDGPVRLYGYGTIGLGYFGTVSSLGDDCGCDWLASTTNYDDLTFAREAGGGLQIRLARRRPVFLDVSARYVRNGRVRYLPEGGIVEQPDGTISVRPVESHANLVVFQIGVSLGMR